MPLLQLRPMTKEDLPAIAALCAARNVHRTEYERFLGLEGAHGLVAEDERAGVVAAVTAMRYFEHGFLGPVLLAERQDGVGIALALLSRAVEGLQRDGVDAVEAEASPDEAVMLENLGFARVRSTTVLEREAAAASADAPTTRAMRAADLLDVGALDATVAGYGRKEYLAALLREEPAGARVALGGDGGVEGYAMLRRSRRGYHLGPLVTRRGDDPALVDALVADALAAAAGYPVVALAPASHAAALERAAFKAVGELVRMRAGAPRAEAAADAATEWLLGGRITG